MHSRSLRLLPFLLAPTAAFAQQEDFSQVQVNATPVAGSVSMLQGEGGNIGVSVGPDGVFLVDDEFAPLVPKIRAAVAKLSPKPIRFVINTHFHGDHTGGNALLGESGVVLVANDNVRKRMSTEQFRSFSKTKVPPAPAVALPMITFAESLTFHLNGDDVEVIHVAPAHTDGDSVVWFRKANVVHVGDLLFNGLYPFIDFGSGGSIDGVVAAADRLLARMDDQTRIIPGHGPLASKAELQRYRDMLATIRDRIRKGIEAGKTLDQVVASKPTAEFDAAWGGGFLKPDAFVALLYGGLKPSN
jgi:cyclase